MERGWVWQRNMHYIQSITQNKTVGFKGTTRLKLSPLTVISQRAKSFPSATIPHPSPAGHPLAIAEVLRPHANSWDHLQVLPSFSACPDLLEPPLGRHLESLSACYIEWLTVLGEAAKHKGSCHGILSGRSNMHEYLAVLINLQTPCPVSPR